MVQIRPFAGWLVAEDFKLEVPTPAHDAMSGQQRRAFVETHASTYLRVERHLACRPKSFQVSESMLLNAV